MNRIEITKKQIEMMNYDNLKGFISYLKTEGFKNKGTLVLDLSGLNELKQEDLLKNKDLKNWYKGLIQHIPDILYFLSIQKDKSKKWSELQFAVFMISDVEIKEDKESLVLDIRMSEELFNRIVKYTAEYMSLTENEGTNILTDEQKDFFARIIGYTSGFHEHTKNRSKL